MIPKVKVNVGNGNLNQTTQTADGVVGLVITGATITGANKVTVGNSYQLFSLADAETLGIAEDNSNAFAWQQLRDFYSEAKTGAELWIMLVPGTVTLEQMADTTKSHAQKLITDSKGAIRTLGIAKKSTGTVTAKDGLDEDVQKAITTAQNLGEQAAANNRPLRIIIDGKDFTGTASDLANYREGSSNRVAILIGNIDGSKNSCLGLLLGRKASNPVQRNPGRVKDGFIAEGEAYFTDGSSVESLEGAWESIHDKGYIFLRSYIGRGGYFFNDAPTLTTLGDDYNDLPKGWVIDKVHRLAYATFLDEILEEIPISEDGQVHPALIKNWESRIETVINQLMTANGEISGVDAYIDPMQKVLVTNELKVHLDILPVGYAKSIPINLGFTAQLNA